MNRRYYIAFGLQCDVIFRNICLIIYKISTKRKSYMKNSCVTIEIFRLANYIISPIILNGLTDLDIKKALRTTTLTTKY